MIQKTYELNLGPFNKHMEILGVSKPEYPVGFLGSIFYYLDQDEIYVKKDMSKYSSIVIPLIEIACAEKKDTKENREKLIFGLEKKIIQLIFKLLNNFDLSLDFDHIFIAIQKQPEILKHPSGSIYTYCEVGICFNE